MDFANEQYCYLTTTGRVSGKPRTIEIWFGLSGPALYMLAGNGERAQWVRNLRKQPRVSVRIGEQAFPGQARVVTDAEEDALARRMLVAKYQPGYSNDLTNWGRTALPIAVDLESTAGGE